MPYTYRAAFGPKAKFLAVLRKDTKTDIEEMLIEDEAILELFTDDELYERFRAIGVTRTIIYKWRKKMEYPPMAVTDRLREILELAEMLEIESGRDQTFIPSDKDGFKTDVYDHPAFAPYIEEFKALVREIGFEDAFLAHSRGNACGCMGPRDGAPFCPCRMVIMTAHKFGKVVCTDDELIKELGITQ